MSELHPQSPEPLDEDEVRVYKQWIKDVLTDGLPDIEQLRFIESRIRLGKEDKALLHNLAINIDTDVMIKDIQDAITQEVENIVAELNANIFHRTYFGVSVVIDDKPNKVESIMGLGDHILPIIDGLPYDGRIKQVIIDE